MWRFHMPRSAGKWTTISGTRCKQYNLSTSDCSPPIATIVTTNGQEPSGTTNRCKPCNSQAEDLSLGSSGEAGWRTLWQGPYRTISMFYREETASSSSPSTRVEAPNRPKPTPYVLSSAIQHLASGVNSSQKPVQSKRVCIQLEVLWGH